MAEAERPITLRKRLAEPVTVGDVRVIPQARALTVRWPNGGLVWNKAVGLYVERGDARDHIAIVDVTRCIQMVLYGLALLMGILTVVSWRKKRRREDGRTEEVDGAVSDQERRESGARSEAAG